MKICRVTTVPFVLTHHLKSQIEELINRGHDVHLVSSASSDFGEALHANLNYKGITKHYIEIPRRISLVADIKALISLYFYFREYQFDVVHSVTSKAGLLSALASIAAGIPVRMHTFAGQPWVDLSGFIGWVARASDKIIVNLNTQCYADSSSQRDFLISERVAKNNQIKVLGHGSIAGVELQRFDIKNFKKDELRNIMAIPVNATVIVFIGRLTHEKGIGELVLAFKNLIENGIKNLHLLLVGPDERGSDLPLLVSQFINECKSIHKVGYTDCPEKYLAMADIFCLPSYREGFGSVVIEAASMGLPAVATRVVGLVDAIVENETGLLVPKKNVDALALALRKLIEDPLLRSRLGLLAKKRAIEIFDSTYVNKLMLYEYENFLQKSKAFK